MKKPLALLVFGSLLVWVVAAYPAHLLGVERALVHSAVAFGICLVPSAVTLAWAFRVADGSPEQKLIMVLGGVGVRMGLVLASGLLLNRLVPYFSSGAFLVWLLVFYLVTLALEMTILVSNTPGADVSPGR